jgi:large subunit ribosomal protein L2
LYRIIDFKRDKKGIPPGGDRRIRSESLRADCVAPLCDGEKRYIIAPLGLKVGQTVVSGPEADIIAGNALPLKAIPVGTTIHNVELRPGKGAQMVRAAGGAAQLVAKEGDWAQLRLPSGEIRRVHIDCYATIGQIGNIEHSNVSLGKAAAVVGWVADQSTRRCDESR